VEGSGSSKEANRKDETKMLFTVKIPKEHHEKVADVLAKIDHVKLNEDRRSGTSVNSDGTVMHFRAIDGDVVEVDLVENPNHVSMEEFEEKLTKRVEQLIAGS
jgi:hypothetical protein